MEVDMSVEEVLEGIRRLNKVEENLSKKKVKKSHPQLMKNALYYFSDWEKAIDKSIS
ncbi:hypothetical protein [Aquibacillus rhizosphaerae]|uniref:Uncharacterized protein n=1 Tax=Aquibacillus rhizosphaerae TaxID=3051431 RepID=A0ABT7L1S8_9BACI|nr:hypothetical protein [Aquibacillus sp. LR5S19]MDL4839773.1 hypothetical protein [Aquibacillus sp. LR5S19]